MHNKALCYVNDGSTCDVTHIIKWWKKTEQVQLINGSLQELNRYNSMNSSNEMKRKGHHSLIQVGGAGTQVGGVRPYKW